MGLLDASTSAGASQNNASSVANSYSHTSAAEANAWAEKQAEKAHERQLELLHETQKYNSAEAEKDRQWQQKNIDTSNLMANTVYTRSVKDMIDAGINPILAANLGLGAAGSGTTAGGAMASVSTPSAFMGSTFAEQNSASHSESQSQGSSWNNSESGLATFLDSMGAWVQGMIGALSSSHTINIALKGLENTIPEDTKTGDGKTVGEHKKAGDYNKSTKEIFKEPLSNPKQFTKDILKYITMKSSGGMIK